MASIALGTQNVSVLEMANAYSTLARGGVRYEPQVITEVKMADTVLPDNRAKGVRVLEKSQADQVNFALEQVVARGSGTGAQVKNTKVKGKTGTTEDYGDAWFVGSTRSLTVAVWMGYPEGQSEQLLNVHGVKKVNGGSLPARIFQRFVERPARRRTTTPPRPPPTSTARPSARSSATPRRRPSVPDPEPAPPPPSPLRRDRHPVRADHHGRADRSRRPACRARPPPTATTDSTANIDSQATVDTTPDTTKPRQATHPARPSPCPRRDLPGRLGR